MRSNWVRGAAVAAWALAAAPVAGAEADGAAVYKDKCITCHGKAGTPPAPFAKRGVKDLSSAEWQQSQSDEQIRESIAKGTEETLMRAFEKELEPEQIDALVAFVRGLRAD